MRRQGWMERGCGTRISFPPPRGRGMRFLLERPKMYNLQPPASLLAGIPSQELARAISNRERTLAASKLAAAFPPASLLAGTWSFYICATARMDGERMRNANFLPSPLWGRGWTASGVLISRGGTGEGVETVSSPHPYRKTRSLARTVGQIDKARELRRHGSRSAGVVCGKSGGHGRVDTGSMGLSRLAF